MSRVASFLRSVTSVPTDAELSALAFELNNNARSLADHLSRLESQPVTVADFLLGRVTHGIAFAHFDALMARADAVLRADADAYYIENGTPSSIASVADSLRGALADAASYRPRAPGKAP